MTKYEIMIIAAAVLVFVIINIIMWKIIAAVNRHAAKKAPVEIQETAVPTLTEQLEMSEVKEHTEELAEVPKKVRIPLVTEESIMFIHTDENLI